MEGKPYKVDVDEQPPQHDQHHHQHQHQHHQQFQQQQQQPPQFPYQPQQQQFQHQHQAPQPQVPPGGQSPPPQHQYQNQTPQFSGMAPGSQMPMGPPGSQMPMGPPGSQVQMVPPGQMRMNTQGGGNGPQQLFGDPLIDGLLNFPVLSVKQSRKGACIECLCGCEVKNLYYTYNPFNMRSPLFVSQEESGCLMRQCCTQLRALEMSIATYQPSPNNAVAIGRELIRLDRPLRCGPGPTCCLRQEMTVRTGRSCMAPDTVLGSINVDYYCCSPLMTVRNAAGEEAYTIKGSCCHCGTATFEILREGQLVGSICKHWGGLGRELFTDADNFTIEFPRMATAAERATLYGCLFLVDYLYYESDPKNRNNC